MALLIRSYYGKMNTMAKSWQDLSQDCSKILTRSCQDVTKISMEGRPGHASMLLLGEGSKATEPYNKYANLFEL